VDELAVERLDEIRPLEDDLRHVGSGLEVAAALELEEIPFGADDWTCGQPLQQARRLRAAQLGAARLGFHAWIASWLPKM
jgi:hypothetical protein